MEISDNKKSANKAGFTLIEMLVVLSIFSFIAVSLFVKNSSFNSNVTLTNLAYEVALSIRQAQVYGLSVKNFDTGAGQSFAVGYGVNFDADNNVDYIFYADSNEDGYYDPPNELVETFSLRRGNILEKFCATESISGVDRCSDTGEISKLDISFKRPNPDAIIRTDLLGYSYRRATIFLVSPEGKSRMIVVRDSGQISIEQPQPIQ